MTNPTLPNKTKEKNANENTPNNLTIHISGVNVSFIKFTIPHYKHIINPMSR